MVSLQMWLFVCLFCSFCINCIVDTSGGLTIECSRYKKKALECHPVRISYFVYFVAAFLNLTTQDLHPENPEKATIQFRKVNCAYQVLSNRTIFFPSFLPSPSILNLNL
jgi:hypothetical protein